VLAILTKIPFAHSGEGEDSIVHEVGDSVDLSEYFFRAISG